MITFQTLITIAPFDDETRAQIASQEPSLTEDQKLQLTQLAWSLLAQQYRAKLDSKVDDILLEIQEGKRAYNREEFKKAEEELDLEFATKLESSQTTEAIQAVKGEIQKHLTNPN